MGDWDGGMFADPMTLQPGEAEHSPAASARCSPAHLMPATRIGAVDPARVSRE